MLRVTVRTPTDAPVTHEIADSGRVCFGRGPDNDIVLDGTYVSRRHGELVRDIEGWSVIPCGSRTPVILIRGAHQQSIPNGMTESLAHGDILQILHTRLEIEMPDGAHAAEHLGLSFVATTGDHPDAEATCVKSARAWRMAGLPPGAGGGGGTADEHAESARSREEARADRARETAAHRNAAARLELLLELTCALGQEDGVPAVLARIGSAVFAAFPEATHFAVSIARPNEPFAPRFSMDRSGARTRVPLSQSLLARVAAEQVAVRFCTSEPGADPSASLLASGISASMAVPLRGARGTLAVLQVDRRGSPLPFSQADLDLLVLLAGCAGAALERAEAVADMAQACDGAVRALLSLMDARDVALGAHARRVAQCAIAMAEAVPHVAPGLLADSDVTPAALRELRCAALLHDLGKLGLGDPALAGAREERPARAPEASAGLHLAPELQATIDLRLALVRALAAPSLREALHACEDDPGATARAEARAARMEADVARARELLASLAGAVDRAAIAELCRFGDRQYVDERGVRRPWLEAAELLALSAAGTAAREDASDADAASGDHIAHGVAALRHIAWPPGMARVPEWVAMHHERLDGSGAPAGLTAADLPAPVRLLAVADVFDALTGEGGLEPDAALAVLDHEAAAGRLDAAWVALLRSSRAFEQRTSEVTQELVASAGLYTADGPTPVQP